MILKLIKQKIKIIKNIFTVKSLKELSFIEILIKKNHHVHEMVMKKCQITFTFKTIMLFNIIN